MLKKEKGMTLLEVILMILVLSVGLTGVLVYFVQGVRNSSNSQIATVANVLAQDLMEEIRSKCWDETSTTLAPCGGAVTASTIGADGGEARASYDDVDDFNGLSNTPPRDSQGNAMPAAFNDYTRSSSVCYVASSDLNTCAGGTSNYKKITVTVSWGSVGDQVQLVGVATNH
jgi:MSHA pilin protein MshD